MGCGSPESGSWCTAVDGETMGCADCTGLLEVVCDGEASRRLLPADGEAELEAGEALLLRGG